MEARTDLPVDSFYQDRLEYSIVGITGVAGSGCSSFAKLVSDKNLLFKAARQPEELIVNYPVERNSEKQRLLKAVDVDTSIDGFVTRKKYEICHNYLSANYQEYDVVKYTKLLWVYLLLAARHYKKAKTGEKLLDAIQWVLNDKFKPSTKHDDALKTAIGYNDKDRKQKIEDIVRGYGDWDLLAKTISEIKVDWIANKFNPTESRDDKKTLSSVFFKDDCFIGFAKYFTDKIAEIDYYSSCFFYHRMATQIRATGNPFKSYDVWFEKKEKGCDYLYVLIRLFVVLIDGRRANGMHRRILIDSIRNSAEALYLRERYSGFYLIAIHDENSIDHLKEKTQKLYEHHHYDDQVVDLFYKSLLSLNKTESEQDDFEKGIFSSPDTDRVIERSEIHIQNIWGDPGTEKDLSLRYMAEQWIRYAALILHPGLVTPTTSERGMAVAYTAKLNSGCLSRQVGAAITNKDGSVRSIGWNEVPHGQVSCSLRTIDGIEKTDQCAICSYSEFELMGVLKYKDGKSFIDKLKEDFGGSLTSIPIKLHGLPFSYCFKSLHNRYEGEKNQVFTRSLHAEENAIIQMSKYGGEALRDGVIYVTASPCELCSKKLYQIGVRQIVYIDPYPGIARQHIISAGFKQPDLKVFEGAIGPTYFKLYQPFMPFKDEISILTEDKHNLNTAGELLKKILKELGEEQKTTYTDDEIKAIINKVKVNKKRKSKTAAPRS